MQAYLFPGQGSQRVGMGEGLFAAFPEITASADSILGLSIEELCLRDPERRLGQTQYTQPALYVVNALTCRRRLEETGERPDFVAGHSLGEYNALECAGALSFEDGLRLVKKRGELMSTAPKGTMAAVIGLTAERVGQILGDNGLAAVDIANLNAEKQIILSGLEPDIRAAQACFEAQQAVYVPLNVSGAFHSRYMQPVVAEFADFLGGFSFAEPRLPVVANVDAQPYRPGEAARTLVEQLTHSVRWLDSMHFLLQQGVTEFLELGPGDVLTKLTRTIRSDFKRSAATAEAGEAPKPAAAQPLAPAAAPQRQDESPRDPQTVVADWNRKHPVGSRVRVEGYQELLTTRTPAVVLFGHRAAVYLQGYNGYFALDEVEPSVPETAPA